MRIGSWNLGHQTQERRLPAAFVDTVKALLPDVLVLNEYVHGDSRREMVANLHTIGLKHYSVSEHIGGQNQVLIASRLPQSLGDLAAPVTSAAATANFLHVVLPNIEIVGMRAPMFKSSALQAAYWQDMENLIQGTKDRRIVFIGDVNCDPDKPKRLGGLALKRLRDTGWQIPKPAGEWSFISKNGKAKVCIDHAICSELIKNPIAEYIARIGDIVLAGANGDNAISDHAALVLEIEA